MRADHQTLFARRLSPTFANGGSRRRPFGWAHPAAVWSSGPLRSLGECALRVGCTPRFRRSTGFAEAVWAGDAGRPLVEQRYSHFRPRADLRLAREQSFNAELPGAARPCRAASGDQNGASLSAALGAFWRGQIECMFYEATTVDAKLNDGWE